MLERVGGEKQLTYRPIALSYKKPVAKSVPSPRCLTKGRAKRWKGGRGKCQESQAADAQEGRGEAGEVCKVLVKTHHPGGNEGGDLSGPDSSMLVMSSFRWVDCGEGVC
jgi:hypothetical protein